MLNRIEPNLPAAAYKTYQIIAPKSTHYRPATCEEVECDMYQNGWKSIIDESTDLGKKQAHYIRYESRRSFKTERLPNGLTSFYFEPGQQCFYEHQVKLDRPEIYVVTGGDFRGNPLGTAPVRHKNAADWQDDFANHQDKLANQRQRA